MKKTLLILSAIAVSGTAFVIAQEGDRPAPRGDRPGRGAGMFANSPLFKAMKMGEDGTIALALPENDEAKKDWKIALADAIIDCDTNKDGKLDRTEIFGEMRRGGGGPGGRRPGGEGGGRPQRPASE